MTPEQTTIQNVQDGFETWLLGIGIFCGVSLFLIWLAYSMDDEDINP